MSKDRLSQIWSGFSRSSSIDLSGTSVNSTPRPSREERAPDTPTFNAPIQATNLPEGVKDPVSAALSAMHTEMSNTTVRKGARQSKATLAGRSSDHSRLPASNVERTLLADLAFTQSKTSRSGSDYLTFAAERQRNWKQRKRKKFLGIF